ncbi:MAG: lipopolysaccharide biosynthesis protein [Bacteroidota bacterium]
MLKTVNRLRKSEFIKNVFTLVSATSVAQGIALLIYPLLTRIYSPAEHGLFALFMSIIAVSAMISTGKYELAVMIPKKDKEGMSLVFLSLLLSMLFSFFLLIIILIFYNRIPLWLGNPDIEKWLYFVPFSTFLIGSFQAFSYWNNRMKKYRNIATANLGQSIVNSIIKLTTSNAIPAGGGLISGAIGGQVAGLLVYLKRFFQKDRNYIREINRPDLKQVAKKFHFFPRYNMPHYLTNNFSSNLPVFVFSSWFSSAEVGLYSLAFLVINRPMSLITNSLTQVFSQRVIEKHNKGEKVRKEVLQLVNRLVLFSFVPFIFIGIFGPRIFGFVFGEEWFQAGRYMQLLLPWLFMVFISSPLSFLPDILALQKKAMWIDIAKFILRMLALSIGVIMKDISVAITLFSAISFILVSYSLYWYVNLSALADKRSEQLTVDKWLKTND